ncbi:flavodoxin domain-containing protein [Erysipelothrix urinaevulpis]|uniref:flavodoxin domain-containing protein n=1 Tax=Erysipelothrix urinaevulpis TaxID=2683717 RepID=UPI00135794D9|nr:flavodoxin domain-containing protein [Erysipelothrix urinaevulpis]
MKQAIVYWTGTGNTQMMAETIMDELESLGFDPSFDFVGDAEISDVEEADWVFLGSPAMTGEDIEELEFRPFFEDIKPLLANKKVVLFGSYDWGGGEWMNSWSKEVEDAEGEIMATLKVQWNPEEEQLNAIREQVRIFFVE